MINCFSLLCRFGKWPELWIVCCSICKTFLVMADSRFPASPQPSHFISNLWYPLSEAQSSEMFTFWPRTRTRRNGSVQLLICCTAVSDIHHQSLRAKQLLQYTITTTTVARAVDGVDHRQGVSRHRMVPYPSRHPHHVYQTSIFLLHHSQRVSCSSPQHRTRWIG